MTYNFRFFLDGGSTGPRSPSPTRGIALHTPPVRSRRRFLRSAWPRAVPKPNRRVNNAATVKSPPLLHPPSTTSPPPPPPPPPPRAIRYAFAAPVEGARRSNGGGGRRRAGGGGAAREGGRQRRLPQALPRDGRAPLHPRRPPRPPRHLLPHQPRRRLPPHVQGQALSLSHAPKPLLSLRLFNLAAMAIGFSVAVQGVREGLRRGGGEGAGATRRQQAGRAGAGEEGVGAAQARRLRRGLRPGDQGAAAVAGRALQRGDARQAGRGGGSQEGD